MEVALAAVFLIQAMLSAALGYGLAKATAKAKEQDGRIRTLEASQASFLSDQRARLEAFEPALAKAADCTDRLDKLTSQLSALGLSRSVESDKKTRSF